MCNDLGKKKNLKNLNIKEYLNKRIKRLYCLKIIETKQNIYDYTIENYKTLQQNVFIATNFSEEIFFVTENLHLATKYIIRH